MQYTSNIEMSQSEEVMIYNLLGYFSTDTGRTFLSNLDDPEVIRMSRKTGNFSSLKQKVTQAHIQELLAHMTGIPVQSISNAESEKLINLEKILHERIVGQDEAVTAIANAIRRSRLGIQNPNRPLASFLFCGPTGVGKTEVTKALAVTMFGSENDMIRFDMSEFMEKFTVSRLVGSPPGYVGYDEGGQLTDAVRAKPYSVVLFDEIEKAHPDILNILLQILEDGRLTDSQKRLVLFDNTIIIMTSNAGAEEIQDVLKEEKFDEPEEDTEEISDGEKEDDEVVYRDPYAGVIRFLQSPIKENYLDDLRKELRTEFRKSFRNMDQYEFLTQQLGYAVVEEEEKKKQDENKVDNDKKEKESALTKKLKSAVLERLGGFFLPEFLNRLDDIIIFKPLRPEELRRICDIMLDELAIRIKTRNITLNVATNVKNKLSREGYNPLFGARPLRRLITKHVEDLICDDLLKNPIPPKGRKIDIILDPYDNIVIAKPRSMDEVVDV
jgi:ATP-dependent Clp protease ATP-binding subunit ClpA